MLKDTKPFLPPPRRPDAATRINGYEHDVVTVDEFDTPLLQIRPLHSHRRPVPVWVQITLVAIIITLTAGATIAAWILVTTVPEVP